MVYKKAMDYYFPFIGKGDIKQLLKFAEAYHPLDFLTIKLIDYLTEHKDEADGPQQHVFERLIAWVEKNILGKVRSFDELQTLLYAQGNLESEIRGISDLIESMIPYRYYEVLSGDEIEYIRKITEKIYKDAVNELFSMALDKPSLMPTQLYKIDEPKVPEYKQEDIFTPWLQGSQYEQI